MWHQRLWCTFSLDLLRRLTDHERLRLGEEIRSEHLLVLVVRYWVVRLGSHDEVGRDELSPLVKELVERMLGIGGGLAKDYGPGRILDVLASTRDCFAVGLHRKLLEIGGEAVQVLVESAYGQYGVN